MGKKAGSKASKGASAAGPALPFLATDERVLDPAVTSLFEQSAGPVHAPAYRNVTKLLSEQKREQQQEQQSRRRGDAGVEDEEGEEEEEEEHPISEHSSDSDNDDDDDDESMSDVDDAEASIPPESSRKRKRSAAKADEDLEDVYMQKLMQREAKEKDAGAEAEKKKRRKVVAPLGDDSETESEDEDEDEDEDVETDADDATSDSDDDDDDDGTAPPVHESLTAEAEKSALDQSRRTVFVGNVSIEAIRSKAAKKTLMEHLVSFAVPHPKSKSPRSEKQSDKPEEQQEGGEKPRIESLRFRSVAFSDASLPKRAAYAKKELMDSTTHSTNAYVVYTTPAAALRAPAALNGSVVLDRHLRVDSVAHPAPVDHKRCVFVGNLAFVDKEAGKEGEDGDDAKKSKSKKRRDAPPADVEEGLWRTFNEHCAVSAAADGGDGGDGPQRHAGAVESVRVVRDRTTRIGKGFAYVQFYNANSVEKALALAGKKFPPRLPRPLRVTRARNVAKRNKAGAATTGAGRAGRGAQQQATMRGRAGHLLGRAGASKLADGAAAASGGKVFVFEGHRASEKGGGDKMKLKVKSRGARAEGKGKAKGKGKGKPNNRSAKRAAAYKARMGYK